MRLDLTKRSDYAIRAMLALTMAPQGLLSSRKIAEEMKIPPRFLPQIMGDLTRAGLAEAHPGRAGGYRLSKKADTVTILTVIEAVEPSLVLDGIRLILERLRRSENLH